MTRETHGQFVARVGHANEVSNALHALQPHICETHPVTADVASLPYTWDEINDAIQSSESMSHDPFEGLAPPVAVPSEQIALDLGRPYECGATHDSGGHGLRCTLDDRHAGNHRDDRYGTEW